MTLDLEEWYHLEYLKLGDHSDTRSMVKHLDDFF